MIKLEFIEDGWEGGPLLLLWGGERGEVCGLMSILDLLTVRTGGRVLFHELPFVESIAGLVLVAVSGDQTSGVRRSGDRFEWHQSLSDWDNTIGLLEPFCEHHDAGTFQFLNQSDGPQVIYSSGRSW